MAYDPDLFAAAHDQYLDDPEKLSDDQVEQLCTVAPKLADRVRAKRAGFVEKLTPELSKPITSATLVWLTNDYLGPSLASFNVRIRELLRRLDALETRAAPSAVPGVKYCGVYQDGQGYPEGSLVTRSGSLWCATTTTADTPGEGKSDWVLVVKRGGA